MRGEINGKSTNGGLERPDLNNRRCESDQNGQQLMHDGVDWVNGIYIWQQIVDADGA